MSRIEEILLEPGGILYRSGDLHDYAYIVAEGEIILYNYIDGKRVDYEIRQSGSIVGELSIMTGKRRTVTVEATKPTRIFAIPSEQIVSRFESLDPVLRACIHTSINFSGTLTKRLSGCNAAPEVVPSTLRDADAVIDQLRLERDVLVGIERDEFSMVFQPIVRMDDGTILGFEALMRWHHPERGFVPPFVFIEVAEAMGVITDLSRIALEKSCESLCRFQKRMCGTNLPFMSVNVSGNDLGGGSGFVDCVGRTLNANGLHPQSLKLELTETAILKHPEDAIEQLRTLRAMGCGISIDDFGVGYSNLGYLKRLPFTTLKIDRTFAGDAHANAISRSIVRMLVTLGSEMGVEVIAEGVETECDVATLLGLGCRYAQGYHFCKPLPEAEIDALLAERNFRGGKDARAA